MALTIWFNRTYATTYWVLDMLRNNPSGQPVRILATHVDDSSPVMAAADKTEPEPDLIGDDYVDWALTFCRRHAVDVFVPRLNMLDIARRVEEFSAIGVAVLTSRAAAIEVLADKGATYRSAQRCGIPVPPWRLADTAQEFKAAYAELRDELAAGERICMKPTVGVGAEGFRILDDRPISVRDLLAPPAPRASLREVVAAIAAARRAGQQTPTFMLLPYLDGPEVSVDCLSRSGQLLAAVPRSKQARRSAIVDDPAAVAIAERVVSTHRLSYLTNTQTRNWRGEPVLLETNTRMSGGLFQTMTTGANLAWAAVQLALGLEVALPPIALGATFTQVLGLVPLTPAHAPAGPAVGDSWPLGYDRRRTSAPA